jgi:hypothetical protein
MIMTTLLEPSKFKRCFLKYVSLLGLSLCITCAHAQVPEYIHQQYAGEEAVYLNRLNHFTIKKTKQGLTAYGEFTDELALLKPAKASMYSSNQVYHGSFYVLKNIEAYAEVNRKKIKVTEFNTQHDDDDNIFYDDSKVTSFVFKGLIPNSIATTKHELEFTNLFLLPREIVASRINVHHFEHTITAPNDCEIGYYLRNAPENLLTFTKEVGRNNTVYRWVGDNIKKLNFGGNTSATHYAPELIFYIKNYKGSNGNIQEHLGTAENLYRWKYSNVKNVIIKNDSITNLANSITKEAKTTMQKAEAIFKWVQNNIRYVAFEAGMEGFVPREPNLVCRRKFGDCKDMATLLVSLYNAAGIPCYYTWIGTRDLPYKFSETPLPLVSNHMIATAFINNNPLFLDATANNCIFGMPSAGIQDKEAMLSIDSATYKILKVPIIPAEQSNWLDSSVVSFDKNTLKGEGKVLVTGYRYTSLKDALEYKTEPEQFEYFKKILNRGSNKFILKQAKVNYLNNSIEVAYSYELPEYAQIIDGELFFNPHLLRPYEATVYDTTDRTYPQDLDYLHGQNSYTLFKLPKHLVPDELPKNVSTSNPTLQGSINYSLQKAKNEMAISQSVQLKKAYFKIPEMVEFNQITTQLSAWYRISINCIKKP